MTDVADLHLHTTFSDGTLLLEDVLKWIQKRSVRLFSITDHDTTAPLQRAQSWALENGIEFIPGVELSVMCAGQEIHVLVYFLQWLDTEFEKILSVIRIQRLERMQKILNKLNDQGIAIQLKSLIAFAGTENLSRAHIGRMLLDRGYVASIQEAFKNYLGFKATCFVPVEGVNSQEGLKAIHRMGGLAFVAHPGLTTNDEILQQLLKEGIDGVEAYHSSHSASQREKYVAWAKENGKLLSGGSDCHGTHQEGVQIGKGNFPYELGHLILKRLEEQAHVARP